MDASPSEQAEALVREVAAALERRARRPRATYRLQFHQGVGFAQAALLAPYLARLGISDLYASPCLKAAPGSTHGYDVVDFGELDPSLGTAEDHAAMTRALEADGLGLLLDFVPNHMAIGSGNPLWMDVLENGPAAQHAYFFDIDWHPIKEELENRVLVPVLGDQYGAVLERGELRLVYEGGAFFVSYLEHRFPVAPRQYARILGLRLCDLKRALPVDSVACDDLLSILTALENLPPRTESCSDRLEVRQREKEAVKRRLAALCDGSPELRSFLEENVRLINGTPGDPASFDLLDGLLREQSFRLAYWRVAAEEINYRRFFDINSLAAFRMEDPRVMRRAHELVLRLVAEGKVTGLRIDHPDGLYDPREYLAGLQQEAALAVARRLWDARRRAEAEQREAVEAKPREAGEDEWARLEPFLRRRLAEEAAAGSSPRLRPLYVVIEKILARDERLPASWASHGSTGYDFLDRVNGLLVDGRNERAVDDTFARFTGLKLDWPELVYRSRRQTMGESMSSEVNVLARQLARLSERDRRTRDFTHDALRRALVEVVACFPVYRTYRSAGGEPVAEHDRRFVEQAVLLARRRNPTLDPSFFRFLREVMLGENEAHLSASARRERREFALKLQQTTAPVMAKSVEDKAFYVYNRLVSLNEVGGDPSRFGVPVELFHQANRERAADWPGSLTATSTHDTKRGEDVRARIATLSEIPGEWRRRLQVWSRLNRRHKARVAESLAPDRNEEILLYQTLLGSWPFGPMGERERASYRERVKAYMVKAVREAKVRSSWTNPDEEWERAVEGFVEALLDPSRSARFLRDLEPFQQKVARAGAFNSLTQVLLKAASPGVPDFYQGNELWDLSLVDPDNRRPVDFGLRRGLLDGLEARLAGEDRASLARELWGAFGDGRVKMFVTWLALRARKALDRLFGEGDYLPLQPVGERAAHLVGFARRRGEQAALVLVPRLTLELQAREPDLAGARAWGDTFVPLPDELQGRRWVDLFTGRALPPGSGEDGAGLWAREAFGGFPVVLALPEEWRSVVGL